MTEKRIALVTGGNRGIGLAACRALAADADMTVLLAARSSEKGQAAAANLREEGLDVVPVELDADDLGSIQSAAVWVKEVYGRLDVLVNNAGINLKADQDALATNPDQIRQTFETNTIGPWMITQAFAPLLRESDGARVVNVSSGVGQLTHMTANNYPAYRVSKTALNAVTRLMAAALEPDGVLVNAMCPGWVKTDMGTDKAPRTPEKAAEGIVALATLPADGGTGQFIRDGRVLSW